MTNGEKRDKLAFIMFSWIYEEAIDDDPTFPERNWAAMTEEMRAPYYRQADKVLRAAVLLDDEDTSTRVQANQGSGHRC